MNPATVWIVGGLVMAGLEMVVPGVFLLWVGLAALASGLLLLLWPMALPFQLLVFVVLAVALVAVIAWRRKAVVDVVNAPAAGLIGQSCRAIAFADREGRVRLGDSTWSARCTGADDPAPGQALRVAGLEGTTLLVTPAN